MRYIVTAKDIEISPVTSKSAHVFIRRHHYSGSSVMNSQLHLGIFLKGRMVGAMQFGPSLDKRKLVGLISKTRWHEFIELNRMAMVDDTPKNTESRALSVAMRIIKKHYPHIKWVVSFADATQCGDGTIYRASNFVLTDIRHNRNTAKLPDGSVIHKMTLESNPTAYRPGGSYYEITGGKYDFAHYVKVLQGHILTGFQLRYIYFLDPTARQRLTVPEIPFNKIIDMGARMYKGKRLKDSSEPLDILSREGGATPTRPLQSLSVKV